MHYSRLASNLEALGCYHIFSAAPQTQGFPNVPFYIFCDFIEDTFSSKVSLATVLLVLFSLTENPELLNLHARQQNPKYKGEYKTVASGWMRALSCIFVKTQRAGVAESREARNRRVKDTASTYVLCPHMGTGVSWNLEVRSGCGNYLEVRRKVRRNRIGVLVDYKLGTSYSELRRCTGM